MQTVYIVESETRGIDWKNVCVEHVVLDEDLAKELVERMTNDFIKGLKKHNYNYYRAIYYYDMPITTREEI